MAKGSYYDKESADYAVAFIESLCHTKGTWTGKPFDLIDWQEKIIRDIFGTLKPNGYRQFNTAYIEIPKKQGKSEFAAAVALLLTCGDGEQRAEVYGCAADRKQASIVFEVAADMVRMCPALSKRVKILASQKRIIYIPTNSFYQVWMPMDKWNMCGYKINEDELYGRVCYGGLDLSSTTDMTAFVLVFPPLDEDDKYIILPYFWLPEDTLVVRVRRDHVPYDIWEKEGYVKTTEGNVIHYGYIERFIEKLGEKFNIREIAFDRWGAVQMVQNLENMGFTVVPFGQGFKDMSPPTKELMKLTLEQRIAHGNHPVLRWNMDNIYVRTDPAGNIKADKEKSTEKIDGAIATIMALDRAIRCGNDNGASVYDDRGLLFI